MGAPRFLADNDGRWIAAYLGVLQAGGVAVPLDTAYKAAQVATVIQNSGATILFTTPRYVDTAEAAANRLGGGALQVALLAGSAPGLPGPTEIDSSTPVEHIADTALDDAAVILYTSGTTADPKGVVLTHANLHAERDAALSIVPVAEHDAVLGVLPLFHALAQMANLLLPLTTGARVVFLETVSSTSLLSALQSRPISIFACVPQFFYLIHQRVSDEVSRGGFVARRLFRILVNVNAWLRDHIGMNPGPDRVSSHPPGARVGDADPRHRRVTIRPGDRPGPVRSRVHAAQRLRTHRDVRWRDGDARWRPVHLLGRPAVSRRRDPHRSARVGR